MIASKTPLHKLTIDIHAPEEQNERAKTYARMTRAIANAFTKAFSDRIDRLVINPPPFFTKKTPWVGCIVAEVADKSLIWEMDRWARRHVVPKLPESWTEITAA